MQGYLIIKTLLWLPVNFVLSMIELLFILGYFVIKRISGKIILT